jgi:pyruvate,orthophosphate dikinase
VGQVDDELSVLRAVRLRLVAKSEQVVAATGLPEGAVAERLAALAGQGLLGDTPRGWRLTPEGQTRLGELLDAERATVDRTAALALHDRFLVQDRALKELVTAHQTAAADPAAPAGPDIAGGLQAFHATARPLVDEVVGLAPRLAPYPDRLTHAVAEVAGGDPRFVAHPLVDSYHSIWFELHEELLHLSGLTRADLAGHDAAG